jgi:alpha-N-acetylglucosamine transferase
MDYIDEYCAITEYRPGEFHKTRTSIFSFIENNEWFDGKIIILSNLTQSLNEKEISQLNQIYSDIELLKVDQQITYDTKKRINKKSLNRDFTSDYLYLYALRIKSKGNIFFSNSVVFKGDVTPFLNENGASFAIRGGSLPFGTGSDIVPCIYYITGGLCSDSLYRSAIKILDNTSNLHAQNVKSMILLAALSENKIEVNRLDAINAVDSSRFPRNKYSEFIRYSKAIRVINFNTLESTDSRTYSRINGFWSSLNSSSINYRPIKANITKREATRTEVDKLKEYYERIKSEKIYSPGNYKNYLIEYDQLLDSKIALCTICNDDFVKGAQVMIHSFLNQNRWFKGDVIVMYSKNLSPLSIHSRESLLKIHSKIKFIEIDESRYSNAIKRFVEKSGLHLKFMPSLFTFEVFAIRGYDAVMYVDSDILHINPMTDMFRHPGDFVVTPASLTYPKISHHEFSGGVFMIRGKMMSQSIRDNLIKFSIKTKRFNLLDQTIMNDFFKRNDKTWAPNDFNCSKRCFNDDNFKNFNRNQISVIHYVSDKPWNTVNSPNSQYRGLESLWHQYYQEKIIPISSGSGSTEKNMGLILTSSSNLPSDYMMYETYTTNWGHKILARPDFYFCCTSESPLMESIISSKLSPKRWIISDSVNRSISNKIKITNRYEIFNHVGSLGDLGKIHLIPSHRRDTPSTGVQMIYYASFKNYSKIKIRGINLYTVRNSNGGYKNFGDTYMENPYKMDSKPHSIETDIRFVFDSFQRFISRGTIVDCDSEILNDILEMSKGASITECIEKIKNKFYS